MYPAENRISVRVPADPSAEWMLDRAPTGNIEWISGDREAFDAAGTRVNGYPTEVLTAVCGDFYSTVPSCDRPGSWQVPTPALLAALPRDSHQLADRLRVDADDIATLDGRIGTALGIDNGDRRQDIIIDPVTGAFIGEREVLADDVDGVPAGTVVSFTSLTTDVVDTIGAVPRR